MLWCAFHLPFQVTAKDQLRIFQRSIIDQLVQILPLIHVVSNLIFHVNRVNLNHAAIGKFQLNIGSIHLNEQEIKRFIFAHLKSFQNASMLP